jgi:hypothetical protein
VAALGHFRGLLPALGRLHLLDHEAAGKSDILIRCADIFGRWVIENPAAVGYHALAF